MDPEVIVSGDELHDSDAEDILDSIWAVNHITKPAIITALNERVFRHLDAALALDKAKNPTGAEYTRMAQDLAMLEARRYTRKRATRGTSDVSITSSRSRASAGLSTTSDKKGKRPSLSATSPSRASPEIVIPNAPTESTSQESGHQSAVIRPPPANWGERVRLQRARNGALSTIGISNIPDQEVIFQDSCPYDMRSRSPQDEDHGKRAAETTIKQESHRLSVPSTTRPEVALAKRARFTGHTAVSPMSQQHYQGRLNPESDPLIGSRNAGERGSDPEQVATHEVAQARRTRPGREPPPHFDFEGLTHRGHAARASSRSSRDPVFEGDNVDQEDVNRTPRARRNEEQQGWDRNRQLVFVTGL